MIRWVVRLAVLLALLVGLDRLAVGIVQGQIAAHVQSAEGLASRPTVKVHGFPFLTQVVNGTYTEVEIDVTGLVKDKLRIDHLQLDARGVKVDLGDAVRGAVRQVPVREGTVRAGIAFTSIDDAVAANARNLARITTSAVPGSRSRVRIDGALTLPGGPYRVSGAADVAITDSRLRVTPLPDVLNLVPLVVRERARALLTTSMTLPALPFGIRIRSATVSSQGVLLVADARGLLIRTDTGRPA
jgi:hypothetical protein